MTKLLLCILLLSALPFGRAQQPVTLEQCQQADVQLNQVYQQLRGTLNNAQKQQLKQAQRDWIKKRDAFVAANPSNTQGAMYQATMQRVGALQGVLQQISGQQVPDKTNETAIVDRIPETSSTEIQNNKIKPIYQEVNWDNPDVVAEAIGKHYRAISILGSNKIYVFDVKTKLLYGVIENDNGLSSECDPAMFICFCGKERYIYSQKGADRGGAYQFNEVPSLLSALGRYCYKRSVTGPFIDNNMNLGVCISHPAYNPNSYCYTPSLKIEILEEDAQNNEFQKKYHSHPIGA